MEIKMIKKDLMKELNIIKSETVQSVKKLKEIVSKDCSNKRNLNISSYDDYFNNNEKLLAKLFQQIIEKCINNKTLYFIIYSTGEIVDVTDSYTSVYEISPDQENIYILTYIENELSKYSLSNIKINVTNCEYSQFYSSFMNPHKIYKFELRW